jgi:hypothetical protein
MFRDRSETERLVTDYNHTYQERKFLEKVNSPHQTPGLLQHPIFWPYCYSPPLLPNSYIKREKKTPILYVLIPAADLLPS